MSPQLIRPIVLMKTSPEIWTPYNQDTFLVPQGVHIIRIPLYRYSIKHTMDPPASSAPFQVQPAATCTAWSAFTCKLWLQTRSLSQTPPTLSPAHPQRHLPQQVLLHRMVREESAAVERFGRPLHNGLVHTVLHPQHVGELGGGVGGGVEESLHECARQASLRSSGGRRWRGEGGVHAGMVVRMLMQCTCCTCEGSGCASNRLARMLACLPLHAQYCYY